MKLVKVSLFGFKSFARRTEFEFGPGVSAIVGPNGCGKSNLVDAIRWALGEQRPKILRSGAMTDLVYRGASDSVPYAEVCLTFDNSDRSLPHPAAELTITRRMATDGIGDYLINERAARLKDLRELFLDTGLGVGGYAFMEQGRIDAILQAGAFERRLLVEEAAGTSRYRLRRREALRKLDKTEVDLNRAGDLLSELERQVRSLKVQAGKARNWKDKKERLERVLLVLYARRSRSLQAALAETLAQKSIELAKEQEVRRGIELEESRLRRREEQEEELATLLSDLKTSLAENRTRIQHLCSRKTDLQSRLEELVVERTDALQRTTRLRDQMGDLDASVATCERNLQELIERERLENQHCQKLRGLRDEVTAGIRAAESRSQAIDQKMLEVAEHQQTLRNQQADLQSELKTARMHRRKVLERSSSLSGSMEALVGEIREQNASAEALAADRGALEQELSAGNEVLARWLGERQTSQGAIEALSAETAGEGSRLQILEEAILRHEGVDEHVRNLLSRAASGEAGLNEIEGIVADLVTTPEATAAAVEAALGPRAEALVVPDREAANRVLGVVRREGLSNVRVISRAELIDPNWNEPAATRGKSRLLSGAIYAAQDEILLNTLLLPFDLLPPDVPMEICTPRPSRALVSAEGEVMPARYETISRGRGNALGLITRRAERERLFHTVKRKSLQIDRLRQDLEEIEKRIEVHEQDREQRLKRHSEMWSQESELKQTLRANRVRLQRLREEWCVEVRDLDWIDRRRADQKSRLGELRSRAEKLLHHREEVQAERQASKDALHALRETLRQHEQDLSERELEAARVIERRAAGRDAVLQAAARRSERAEELELLERRLEEQQEQQRSLDEALQVAAADIAGLEAATVSAGQDLSAHHERWTLHRQESSALKESISHLRRDLESLTRQVQALEIKEREHRLHLEMLSERAREELSSTLEVLSERLDEWTQTPAEVAAAGVEGSDVARTITSWCRADLTALQAEADQLKAALQRLGPVNLEAVEELDDIEGRARFLAHQREDLTEARRTLRKMIEEIDRECEARFAATFDQVQAHFRGLFRRLFGGGRADLLLLESDDPAEAGVEVMAAPPGKDPRSIQMLSGGERTLTAVALLFALFSTRPSPFCVLDEVDAALDESNIERFTTMLREFLDTTQFLIVTHSKRTMAVADTLYGVTMEGNGISRPIAMRFESERVRGHVA